MTSSDGGGGAYRALSSGMILVTEPGLPVPDGAFRVGEVVRQTGPDRVVIS